MNALGDIGNGVTVEAKDLIALRGLASSELAQQQSISALPGGFAIARRGNGQVVADSRIYSNGDDLRHVDRGATARTGTLHVRTFHEERDRVTFLIADFRSSMLWGMRRRLRSVAAAQMLALLGWQAVEAGGRVGALAITADERFLVPSRPRTSGMLGVIGTLVQAHDHAQSNATSSHSDPSLAVSLSGLERLVPRGSEMIIISAMDNMGDGLQEILGRLSRHRTVRFMMIEDSSLRDLPTGTYPLRLSEGTKAHAMFRSRDMPEIPDMSALHGYQVDVIDAAFSIMQVQRRG